MHASAMLALSLLQARLIDLNLLLKVKQRPRKQLSAIELRAQAKLIAPRQAAASIAASLTKERSIGSEQARSFVFGPKWRKLLW